MHGLCFTYQIPIRHLSWIRVAVLPATLSAGTRQKRGTSFLLVADRPVGIRNIQFLEEVQPRSVLKPSQAISAFKALLPFSKPSQSISITRIWQDIRQTHDTLCSLCHPLSYLSFWKLWLGLGHSVHNMKRQKPSKANQHERKPGNHILASWKFKVPSPSASQVPHSVAKTATDWTALVTLSRSSWTNKQKSQISPKTVFIGGGRFIR